MYWEFYLTKQFKHAEEERREFEIFHIFTFRWFKSHIPLKVWRLLEFPSLTASRSHFNKKKIANYNWKITQLHKLRYKDNVTEVFRASPNSETP